MKPTSFFRKYWSFILATILLAVELMLLLAVASFQSNYIHINMPLFLLTEYLGQGFTLVCSILFLLPFLAFLDYKIVTKRILLLRIVAILMMFVLYIVDVQATFKGYNLTGDFFSLVDNFQNPAREEQYYLVSHKYSGGDSTYPIDLLLYECGRWGIKCKLVYIYEGYSDTLDTYIEEDLDGQIAIYIDNQKVYTYATMVDN